MRLFIYFLLVTAAFNAAAEDSAESALIASIDVRGLTHLNEQTVLQLIQSAKGRRYSDKVWDADFHRLYDSGYFINVRTSQPQILPNGVHLSMDLMEKAVLRKFEFHGNASISTSKLLGLMTSHEGGTFDPGEIHKDRMKIEKLYRDEAFYNIKLDYKVETISSHHQNFGGNDIEIQDEVRVSFTANEDFPVGVDTIHFAGLSSFSEKELLAVMETKQCGTIDFAALKDDVLEDDKNRLLYHYRKNGFLDAEISGIDIDISPVADSATLHRRMRLAKLAIHVREGGQYRTGNLVIEGNESISFDELQSVMRLRPGAVYSDILLYQDDMDRIKELYAKRGLPLTKVLPSRNFVTDAARLKVNPNLYDVTIDIREQPIDNVSVGRTIMIVGLGFFLGMLGVILWPAVTKRQRPRFSLSFLLILTLAGSVAVYGGVRSWKAAQALQKFEAPEK